MMKSSTKPYLLVLAVGCVIFSTSVGAAPPADIRPPAKAGSWYPADAAALQKDLANLTRQAQKTTVAIPPEATLKAIILPHAGYVYAGWTAAHAADLLRGKNFSKVVLMGPDHYVGFRNGAISAVSGYRTPLGTVNLHADAAKLRLQSDFFQAIPESDRNEHSLEMVLLYLQYYLKDFELIPVVLGPTDIERCADLTDAILDSRTLLVVSSDLSHFLPYSEAVARDRETINRILNLDSSNLLASDNRACGAVPISVLITLAKRHNWKPLFLHYSNSGDTAGDRLRVVGYAAIAFWGDLSMQSNHHPNAHFSQEQGQLLVKLARHTIMKKLGQEVNAGEATALAEALQTKSFQSPCGTFVTLKIHGRLRGCIGNLTATESVSEGVRRNAINAAFSDPRFKPLSAEELGQTEIEVSILTEPRPLEYRDGEELINKLRVNVDGVIIRKGYASATFLPQVWEQLPRPEDFLAHLCMKAGLPADAWKDPELEVSTYQVQYFEEQH